MVRVRMTPAPRSPVALARLALGDAPQALAQLTDGERKAHKALMAVLGRFEAIVDQAVTDAAAARQFNQETRIRRMREIEQRVVAGRRALLQEARELVAKTEADFARKRAERLGSGGSDPARFTAAMVEVSALLDLRAFNAGSLAEALETELRLAADSFDGPSGSIFSEPPPRVKTLGPRARAILVHGQRLAKDGRATPKARARFATLLDQAERAALGLAVDETAHLQKALPILELVLAGRDVPGEIMSEVNRRAGELARARQGA